MYYACCWELCSTIYEILVSRFESVHADVCRTLFPHVLCTQRTLQIKEHNVVRHTPRPLHYNAV